MSGLHKQVTSKLKNKGGDNIEFVRQPQVEVLLVECWYDRI